MNKRRIIQSVKRQEEEKVGFSLKLPASLKEQLQNLAETESISMNALIVATLQSMIDDDCGKKIEQAKVLLSDYQEELEINIKSTESYGVDGENEDNYKKLISNSKKIEEFLKED